MEFKLKRSSVEQQPQSNNITSLSPTSILLKMASPEVRSILILTPELTIALSNELLGMAGSLLSKGFISGDIMSKMLVLAYTPKERATILVEAVRNKIELAPSKFDQLLEILSEFTCIEEVVESLRSTYQSELD